MNLAWVIDGILRIYHKPTIGALRILGMSWGVKSTCLEVESRVGCLSPTWWRKYAKMVVPNLVPSLKLRFLPLKMDGWNTIVSFWDGLLSGSMLVSGSVS